MMLTTGLLIETVPSRACTLPGDADADLERGEIVPDVVGPFARQHQRRAMQIERMDHHQVVGVAEILDRQSVGINETAIP